MVKEAKFRAMSGSRGFSATRSSERNQFSNTPVNWRQQQQQQQQQQQLPTSSMYSTPRTGYWVEPEYERMEFPQPSSNHFPLPPEQQATVTNLDRLMEALTPHVAVHSSSLESQDTASDEGNQAFEMLPYYCLKDVWKEITEWSFYGVGVPLLLKGTDSVVQYYFPTLSGIQLYVDPSKLPSRLRSNAGSSRERTIAGSKMNRFALNSSSRNEAENSSSCGVLVFEYMERESPFVRLPLIDKICSLTTDQFPELMTLNSCDLLPTSWICVAWYPICRIPLGPTLRELDTAFLTFHNLSTQSRGNDQPWFPGPSDGNIHVDDASMKIPVPVFGLASYKLWGSIIAPTDPHECQQASRLWHSASQWLSHLKVYLPDYNFFNAHYNKMR